MGFTIIVGEAALEKSNEVVSVIAAPKSNIPGVLPVHGNNSNCLKMQYVAWVEMSRRLGISRVFFGDKVEGGHPVIVQPFFRKECYTEKPFRASLLTQKDLDYINAATKTAKEKAETDTKIRQDMEYLVWLKLIFAWALTTCDVPIIAIR